MIKQPEVQLLTNQSLINLLEKFVADVTVYNDESFVEFSNGMRWLKQPLHVYDLREFLKWLKKNNDGKVQ